jgi:formylglycine-generating enzyme required for sulfatase activity
MKHVLLLLLIFLSLNTFSQPATAKPKVNTPVMQSKPGAAKVSMALVNINWQGNSPVIIKLDEKEYTLAGKGSASANLPLGSAIKLAIVTPLKEFPASEFLHIDSSGGDLSLNLNGDYAVFQYENGLQKRLREQLNIQEILELQQHMVFVQGGIFTMGCNYEQGSGCGSDEEPAHSVTLSSYRIGKYEVTQAQWQVVMGSNPSGFKGCDNCPVENVSWNDIQEFLRKLNGLTGQHYRLPTEAEWEYAARGGNRSKGYKYSGSNSLSSVAWYGNNSDSSTHPVGKKSPNELGLYDMSGNVWEWCSDFYGEHYYTFSPNNNPEGPSSGSFRVVRGGDWDYFAMRSRVANRDFMTPDYRINSFGFRVAVSQ